MAGVARRCCVRRVGKVDCMDQAPCPVACGDGWLWGVIPYSLARAASLSASSAPTLASPDPHLEMRGCGMPVRAAISICDKPGGAACKRLIKVEIWLMRNILCAFALLTQCLNEIYFWHSEFMKPGKLLAILMQRSGYRATTLAAALNNPKVSQPQINKFVHGVVAQPKNEFLEPIADFYGLSVEVFIKPEMASATLKTLPDKVVPVRRHIAVQPAGMVLELSTAARTLVVSPEALLVAEMFDQFTQSGPMRYAMLAQVSALIVASKQVPAPNATPSPTVIAKKPSAKSHS